MEKFVNLTALYVNRKSGHIQQRSKSVVSEGAVFSLK